jgi:hypothetical protein
MKNSLLTKVVLAVLVACIMSASAAMAIDITLNGSDPWLGFMNVFNLPADGGAYQFGSPWGTGDLTATFAGDVMTFTPNSIGDPDPYWYIGGGGPGAPGNKIMEANMYVEPAGSLPGMTVTFSGVVISNSLTSAHACKAFIRDFAPDFSSVVEQSVPLGAAGVFSIMLNTINDPARHVQYGIQMVGPNVWVTDLPQFGSIVIGPANAIPVEPTTWGAVKSLYR